MIKPVGALLPHSLTELALVVTIAFRGNSTQATYLQPLLLLQSEVSWLALAAMLREQFEQLTIKYLLRLILLIHRPKSQLYP